MRISLLFLLLLQLTACKLMNKNDHDMGNGLKSDFNDSLNGKSVGMYTLTNANNVRVDITNYGATIVRLYVPDRNGKLEDIVLGYDSLAGYYQGKSYFGTIVGRYANRIANAKFALDGKEYKLAANNGMNTLHGGLKGFDKVVWDAAQDGSGVTFTYTSKDGEEGYPGNLTVSVRYELNNANELNIQYRAETDKTTVLNLSNHSYFNLDGQGKGNILSHELTLHADAFTPVDSTLIPTGEMKKVSGTPFDFTSPHPIGERVNDTADMQIRYGLGYDHNFVLKGENGKMKPAASVYSPASGRTLEVETTEPGIQFYCGNFLDGSEKGKGSVYQHRYGFCLETQHFPDSPNQPSFPTTVLKPGEEFRSATIFRFGVKK
jgi:aldose 1-epimerase